MADLTPNDTITLMEKLTKKEQKALRHAERVEMEERAERRKKWKDYAFWGGFVVILLLSVGAIIYFSMPRTGKTTEVMAEASTNLPPVSAADYSSGPKNAQITLIEYGDFQCPACSHYFPMITQLKKDFKDTVRVIYRNFPLTSVHKNAQIAAQAAYAAGKQGKFWEMHDLLYENQTKWADSTTPDQIFAQYAVQLGLDPVQFTTDMTSKEAVDFIAAQASGGEKAGVQGTPTFFLNGHLLENPTDYNQLKATVEQEVK